jgi:putative nucleotidyltransferase with HDIG domain
MISKNKTEPFLAEILSKIKSFPSMPEAAIKLLALVDDSEVSVSQIEDILRHDPGLTANILKMANAAYFGIPSKVGSVSQAVVILGFKRLIQMVIATCVSAVMDQSVPGYDISPGELWRHSLAVSVAAESLLKELKIEAAEEIFTAALLHDVGKLVLGEFVKDDFEKLENAMAPGLSFEKAEFVVLGMNHAEVGAQILAQWSLPRDIINAVRWHHNPESADRTDMMLDIVHVANVLCRMIGVGAGRDGLQYRPSAVVAGRLGLESHHLEEVASQTLQGASELSDLLSSN